jgi:hypothetical protein
MRYAIITPDGNLTHHDGDLDWHTVIGPEGRARVRLDARTATAGWVNDCGLFDPKTYPRNPVGSCILYTLGAHIQPYAGPVVITGWNAANTARGLIEICDLPQNMRDALDDLHGDVLKALAGQTPRTYSPSWAEQTREIADHVRTAPTPGITIRTVRLP